MLGLTMEKLVLVGINNHHSLLRVDFYAIDMYTFGAQIPS